VSYIEPFHSFNIDRLVIAMLFYTTEFERF